MTLDFSYRPVDKSTGTEQCPELVTGFGDMHTNVLRISASATPRGLSLVGFEAYYCLSRHNDDMFWKFPWAWMQKLHRSDSDIAVGREEMMQPWARVRWAFKVVEVQPAFCS